MNPIRDDNSLADSFSQTVPTEDTFPSVSSAQTVIGALTAWARERRKWLETLVFQATNLRRNLSDGELNVVFEMLEVECGFKESTSAAHTVVQPTVAAVPTFQSLSLGELSAFENINALVDGQKLTFHDNLTIFFGENGCGKSGYARVLKWIAGARGAEELIPNVFVATPKAPKATIVYKIDQQETTLDWANERGVEPLTAIQAFDGRAAEIHLDEDLAYSYSPRELDSFDFVQDALEKIRKQLDSVRNRLRQEVAEFINALKPGSMLFRVATADDTKDHAEFAERLGKLNELELSDLKTLPDDIEALKSSSVAAEIRLRTQRSRLLEAITNQFTKLLAFDSAQYASALSELLESITAERQISSEAFSSTNIPKVLEQSWRTFIIGGEDYIKHVALDPYPQENDSCIYCRQPLQAAALELVRKYRDLCNSTAAAAIGHANGRLAILAKPLTDFDGQPFGEAQTQLEIGEDELLQKAANLFEQLNICRSRINSNEALQIDDVISEAGDFISSLRIEIAHLQQTIVDLSGEESIRQEAVGKKAQRLSGLSERLDLNSYIDKLRAYDVGLTQVAKAESELADSVSFQRALTITAKEVSEKLLNEAFDTEFRKECKVLNAPTVRLAFPGRMGRVIRHKGVGTSHKLSAILSEGEQKVIALADFLAELSLRPEKVPVVFDDPVTSLDYRRIREVAQRLSALAAKTQVVIFTHNIMFVAELLDVADAKDFIYYDIRRRSTQPGFVSVGTNPRIDSFRKLKARINIAISEAKKTLNAEEQRKQVEIIYEHLRSACEVLVEQELLKKLTERYLPNIKMTVLANINYDKLQPAAMVVLEIFEKACRFIPGHSQPLETLAIVPTLDELEKDWETLQKAKTEYDT